MLKFKICFAVTEVQGLIKSGGLADVARALPKALAELGHELSIFLPGYSKTLGYQESEEILSTHLDYWPHTPYKIKKQFLEEVPVYLIEAPQYYDRDELYAENNIAYTDNGERFAFFSAAVLDAIPKLGITPDIVHANDWHTGLIPFLLKSRYKNHHELSHVKSVLTVHNAIFQGVFPLKELEVIPELKCEGEKALVSPTHVGMLKAGLVYADKINAVSPNYALELRTHLGSHGLAEEFNKRADDLSGILNGCDYSEWNPRTDSYLPLTYSNDTDSMQKGKHAARKLLLEEAGLKENDGPVFGMVCRLSHQKGFGYILPILEHFLANDVRLIILGTGDSNIAQSLRDVERHHNEKFCFVEAYSNRLAHIVEAGSDFFLMPSEYEACGLSQIYSMAYGTLPIVREVGGLKDTVIDIDVHPDRATGFSFHYPIAKDLLMKLQRAVIYYYQSRDEMLRVQKRAMEQDFSWKCSAEKYVEMYRTTQT
ncbi:glycogen synthase GlgA [Vibrio sp. HN007]|uniref:glycogen synthase GlgA n=1 Tax=Vibrio iocasae TaxID=3098914 RepID=UPI0035D4B155